MPIHLYWQTLSDRVLSRRRRAGYDAATRVRDAVHAKSRAHTLSRVMRYRQSKIMSRVPSVVRGRASCRSHGADGTFREDAKSPNRP